MLRSTLERERARLLGDLAWSDAATRALGEAQAEEGASFGSLGDLASDLAGQEVTLTLARAERQRLGEVERALHRMDTGTYGACEACGAAIERERLRVLPWTRQCRRCVEQPARVKRPGALARA
jgi:RNA polymerase-binding transcription factor